jgi:hypothetical protein
VRRAIRVALLMGLFLLSTTGSALAEAETFTDNEKVSVDPAAVFVSCAAGGEGEVVDLSGTLHILSHTTVTPSGDVFIKFHFQPQGVKGVGQTTGDVYQGTGVTQGQTLLQADGLPFTDTLTNNFRIIGPGPGNNYLEHFTIHVTINENGELTAEVSNISIVCK